MLPTTLTVSYVTTWRLRRLLAGHNNYVVFLPIESLSTGIELYPTITYGYDGDLS